MCFYSFHSFLRQHTEDIYQRHGLNSPLDMTAPDESVLMDMFDSRSSFTDLHMKHDEAITAMSTAAV